MIDGEAVTTIGKVSALGDTGVLLLVPELTAGEHQWPGVVAVLFDSGPRPRPDHDEELTGLLASAGTPMR